MTRAQFDQVENLLHQNWLTRDGWGEFEETVLREEKRETGEVSVFNTRPAADFFPHTRVDQGVSAYHRLMPTVLTSLGLLGTFLALLIGLHSVHVDTENAPRRVTSSAESEVEREQPAPQVKEQQKTQPTAVKGIDDLVNSLSGKFLSSIIALFLAVLYNIFEARRLRAATRAHETFCGAFDALFVRRTPEALLQRIYLKIEDQTVAFQHFDGDLSGYLKQSFQESLGPHLANLAQALERMASGNEDRIAELAGSLSETFQSSLTKSAEGQFQQLAASLARTAELLDRMNNQSHSTQEGLGTLLVRLDESQRQQAAASEAQRRAVEEMVAQIARQVQGVATQSSTTLDQTVARLLERTTAASNETATNIAQVLTDHSRMFEERMATLLARLDTIVAEMGRSSQSGSERLSAAVSDVVTRLEETVAAAATTVHGATADVVRQTGDASVELSARVREILDRQTKQADAADAARESLDEATQRVRTLLSETGRVVAQVAPMVSDLAAASRDLRSVSEVARAAEQELQQVAAQFAQQGTTLNQTADRHQALLDQYRNVFDRIQQGLGAVLQQLADGMQRYHEASRTGLREHLEEFDNHLAAATQQIKGSVEGIREGLETLTDAIDTAATRIGGDGKGSR